MIKLIYVLTVIVMMPFFSCAQGNSDEMIIGKIENNTLVMTAKESDVKVILERTLVRNDNNAEITKMELKKDIMEGSDNESYYYLVGNNKDQTTKIATELILKDNILSARVAMFTNGLEFAETCTCSGSCTMGCDPRRWVDEYNVIAWLCSPCKQSGKTCNKSVSTGG